MAIKIIKEGTKKPKFYRVECNKCGCVFEYEEGDIFYDEPFSNFHLLAPELCRFHIMCPQCNNECEHTEQNEYEGN